MKRYQDILALRKGYATLFTSRGCPYRCTFCDPTARLGRKFRAQSPERVMAEIRNLYDNYGIREINFYDDTFTFDKKRIHGLCDLLIKEKMNLIWECRTRVNNVDRDLLRKMARAGCYRIRYGVESGDERILKVIKKGIRLDQAREAFRHTREAGIDTVAYFMLGLPEETEETVRRTIDFAVELNPTYVLFAITVLSITRSEMFQWAVQQGYIESDHWARYIRGEDLNPHPRLVTERLSEETLERYLKLAYKRFYLRPGFAWQLLRNVCRSPSKITTYLRLSGEMASQLM